MALNLQGKLCDALLAKCVQSGCEIWHEDGVPKTKNEAAAQAVIDAFDLLGSQKSDRIALIKAEALGRINAAFPAIKSLDEIEFFSELWSSIKATSKAATVKFQKVIDIYSAAKTAIASVNAATTKSGVDAVVVGWPA